MMRRPVATSWSAEIRSRWFFGQDRARARDEAEGKALGRCERSAEEPNLRPAELLSAVFAELLAFGATRDIHGGPGTQVDAELTDRLA